LMDVNGRRLCSIGDQQDRAQPDTALKIHVRVPKIRAEVNTVGWSSFVQVNPTAWRWPAEASHNG
jgi:hypothetical protein